MATTTREALLAQLLTDVRAINGTGSFQNQLRRVERGSWTHSQLGVYPSACLVDGGERAGDVAASTIRDFRILELFVVVYAERELNVAAETTLNSLYGDILLVMVSNSYIEHTFNAHLTVDAGYDPLDIEQAHIIGFVARFDVHYSRLRNDPTSP